MDSPRSTVYITEFSGLVSNRGRFAPNASDALVQTNMGSIRQGRLETRPGFNSVTYSAALGNGSSDIISVYFYDTTTPTIIVESADGKVNTGTNPRTT